MWYMKGIWWYTLFNLISITKFYREVQNKQKSQLFSQLFNQIMVLKIYIKSINFYFTRIDAVIVTIVFLLIVIKHIGA